VFGSKRAVTASCLAVLVFSLSFTGVATAAASAVPGYQAGDFWKYYVMKYTKMQKPNDTFYFNETWVYNVTGEEALTVNGTAYSAYNVSVSMNSTGLVMCGMLAHHVWTFMNGTEYWETGNLSKILSMEEANTTMTPGGWRWSIVEDSYTAPDRPTLFPLAVGNTWFNNYSFYEKAHYKSVNYGMFSEKWMNGTVESNNSYLCELQETVGTYDCCKVKRQDPGNLTIQPTYAWFSNAAGGRMVQKLIPVATSNENGYEWWTLVEGSFNNTGLPPVPLPVVSELAALLPLCAVASVLFIFTRKKR